MAVYDSSLLYASCCLNVQCPLGSRECRVLNLQGTYRVYSLETECKPDRSNVHGRHQMPPGDSRRGQE